MLVDKNASEANSHERCIFKSRWQSRSPTGLCKVDERHRAGTGRPPSAAGGDGERRSGIPRTRVLLRDPPEPAQQPAERFLGSGTTFAS